MPVAVEPITSAKPEDSYETKACYLRWLHRRERDSDFELWQGQEHSGRWQIIRAEYERLFGTPSNGGELEFLLKDAWIEAREMAGWSYCVLVQVWARADGSWVNFDDGSEWRHL